MIKKAGLFVLALILACVTIFAQQSVNIGLLIQDKSELSALRGAELAVKIANQHGGLNGLKFNLVTKSMEGPWGTGSKQAVSLIWEDQVCVLLGSHDGRNAHLVEQASAKSIVPFVSAWSSDPTLSYAYIPWFFNVVPNDEQQAQILINEIFNAKGLARELIIVDETYDSKQAAGSYLKYSDIRGRIPPVTINFEEFRNRPELFTGMIRASGTDCIVMLCGPETALISTRLFQKNHITMPVYGSFLTLNENRMSEMDFRMLKTKVIVPDAGWPAPKLNDFKNLYKSTYGTDPGPVAIFAFDAMNTVIEAIRKAGDTDNESIREALAGIRYEGVTGTVHFGKLGIRSDSGLFDKK